MTEHPEPHLAPPGAGVPLLQRLALRWYFGPRVAAKSSWDDNAARFQSVTRGMEEELTAIASEDLKRRVLVPPQQGLEDSSRFWSAAMTLEHVVIVGRGVCGVIKSLAEGRVPAGQASTATVKPTGGFEPGAAVSAFRQFCSVEAPGLMRFKDTPSTLTFRHPWMGPLTARGWHWMLTAHHAVHLKQLREIRRGL